MLNQQWRWSQLSKPGRTPTMVAGRAEAVEQYTRLRRQIASVAGSAQMEDWGAWSLGVVQSAMGHLAAEREVLYRMPEVNSLTERLVAKGLGRLLDELATRDPTAAEAAATLHRAWLSSVLEALRAKLPVLGGFVGRQHSRIVDEFKDADEAHIRANAARVRHTAAERLRVVRDQHPLQVWEIKNQAGRRVRQAPLRDLIRKAPDVLLALHPCWAMSPLVVSRVLPPVRMFDVVVFDEASQIEPHTAIPSIMRGRQIVVAGDEKQLPPTTFYERTLSDDDSIADDDMDKGADLGLYESILDRLKSIVPQRHSLTWHYRSRDERLIAFANKEVYDGKLITFPGVGAEPPIALEVVDGRVVPGQEGSAPEEVERVVQLVLDHAARRPQETLGVITLGLPHAARIETALGAALREDPELSSSFFFSRDLDPRRRFFIKNLERVQGDERDAIILSLGHAKSPTGRLTMNFGPLTHEGGERRLNVAVTRARVRMTVVSSFNHHDMAPAMARTSNQGPELLRRFLEFAAGRGVVGLPGRTLDVQLNHFEKNVLDALVCAGIPVFPQWGVAGYRIDFALAHPEFPGRMVLAVETDGVRYHRAASARDRDRLRQAHLERLGWIFCRVWSIDWYRDPRAETMRIVEAWRRACSEIDLSAASSAR